MALLKNLYALSVPSLTEDHAQHTKLPAHQAIQVIQLQRRRNSKYSKAPPPERIHNAPGKGASIYKFTQSYNLVRGEKPTRIPKLPAAPP